uniref:Cysteine proteinase inhibitor n=1 Tax=Haemonchus contortus TaxID=6289 RepID=A0A7I4YII5_HAECO
MVRQFLAFLIIGAVAVGQLMPPQKDNGIGQERAYITMHALLNANRTAVEEETEIRNNASRLGLVKRLQTWHDSDYAFYTLHLVDTDCSKAVGWLKDIVRNTNTFTMATLSCRPMDTIYYPYVNLTIITRKTIQKIQGEIEPL